MSQVDFHSLNATRRRSAGVLPLKTAAISSETISRSLSSICMGGGPIFAQDLEAVNPPSEKERYPRLDLDFLRLKVAGRSAIMRGLSKGPK